MEGVIIIGALIWLIAVLGEKIGPIAYVFLIIPFVMIFGR